MEPVEFRTRGGSVDRRPEIRPVEPVELDPDHRQMEPMELLADGTAGILRREPSFRQIQPEQISRRI